MNYFLTAYRSLRYGAPILSRKAFAATFVFCAGWVPVQAETVTIAAFGDSLTAGYGLPVEDGFTSQLQSWLRDRGHDVAVLNAGVSGDTTAGGLARIDWTLTDDVDAVIVELGPNDMLRGLPPEDAMKNLDGIMAAISGRGLPSILSGVPAPPNFGGDYKTTFDAIYPALGKKYGALVYPNFLYGIGSAGDLPAVAALMQADGLHPNAKGVARIVADIGPLVEELVGMVNAD